MCAFPSLTCVNASPIAFIGYTVFAVAVIVFLIFFVAPTHGQSNIFVYLGICSLAGSLSVMSCKALGIALKLTFQGDNQLVYMETHVCLLVGGLRRGIS